MTGASNTTVVLIWRRKPQSAVVRRAVRDVEPVTPDLTQTFPATARGTYTFGGREYACAFVHNVVGPPDALGLSEGWWQHVRADGRL